MCLNKQIGTYISLLWLYISMLLGRVVVLKVSGSLSIFYAKLFVLEKSLVLKL